MEQLQEHQKRMNQTIPEQDGEESEVSAVNINTGGDIAISKRELEEKKAVINKYKRIDTVTINRVGIK